MLKPLIHEKIRWLQIWLSSLSMTPFKYAIVTLITIFLFQHYLTMISAIVSIPFILTPALCMVEDDPAKSYIISTMIFVTAIVTFFQVTFGCRYTFFFNIYYFLYTITMIFNI